MSRIIFITGTDTGVGKTVLTCLLLQHLRSNGVKALAMKPFCSGGTEDLEAIRRIQGDELAPEFLNPYYFPEPLAPAVAAERAGTRIELRKVLATINLAAKQCECLLVEGAGGLLVPITSRRTIADLIADLQCEVIVVTQNKLGTLNHTLLTLESLRFRTVHRIKVVFFESPCPDPSAKSNARWIGKTAVNTGLFSLPWLRSASQNSSPNLRDAKNFKKTLAQICDPDNVCSVVRTAEAKQRNERLKKRKINR